MHNRLSIRRYSVSTGAYLLVVLDSVVILTYIKGAVMRKGCIVLYKALSGL